MTNLNNRRKWTAFALLSIVLPMSLLATFRLTGLLQEPSKPEVVIGEAVTWESERPDYILGIQETVENSYMDEDCSILFNILISSCILGPDLYGASDFLSMGTEVEANVSNGFVEGLRISFSENYNLSQINIWEKDVLPESENLRTRNVVDHADGKGCTGGLGESSKGYVEAVGVNKPSSVYYRIWVDWILRSPQNQSHQMEARLQLTYNNGTALKEAVLPVVLKLALDAGGTFETAKGIGFGNYTGWIHFITDPEDFFKVWMDEGKTVKIESSTQGGGYTLDLHLYNTSRHLVASSRSKILEEITFTISQSGWWYIRAVNAYGGYGLYTLSIQEAEPQ